MKSSTRSFETGHARTALALAAALIWAGCSGQEGMTPSQQNPATGGLAQAFGGSAPSGGFAAAGGAGTGGRTSGTVGGSMTVSGGANGGGLAATGGMSTTVGGSTGGRSANGGSKSSGGAQATGGTPVIGGMTSTAAGGASGGSKNTGGAAPVTGGTRAMGGGSAAGGTSATPAGGSKASGGTASTGGSAAGGSPGAACVAIDAVAAMKIGWNLGNSLDSVDSSKSDTTVETAWGNPTITPALIQTVANAGFGVVRIPVTWINRFGAAPNYTISSTFIARVEEVVNYVLDRNLFAIINLHHDGGEGATGQWISLVDGSKQVTTANNDKVVDQFTKIWTQIATRFKDYDNHLIFEGMNEIHVGYDAPLQAYHDQVNRLNQAFVTTVRATGGNNANRCLVVPGYNTNIDYTVAGFVAPTDTSAGKLILSDHYYDPWDFAGAAKTHAWGAGNPGIDTWGQEDHVRNQVAKLKTTFIDKGLPVIWGEYGAVNQNGYENYRRYYMEYVTKAAHDAGIVPMFWDRGATNSGEDAFGLINRSSNSVQFPTILEAMLRAVNSSYTLNDVEKP